MKAVDRSERKLSEVLTLNAEDEVAPRLSWQDAKRVMREELAKRRPHVVANWPTRMCPHCGVETAFTVCGDCDDKGLT